MRPFEYQKCFHLIRSAFTLIELLVVIAIIAILAVVVVLTLNPAQLLAQSRDANRVSDMATLNTAIGLYQADTGGAGNMGTSTVVYNSLVDNASSTCGSLGLSALPMGYIYGCSTSTSSRLINSQGWLPLNFSLISSGAPFGSLPIDPINTSSSGLFYMYASTGTQYMVSALPESQKQKQLLAQKPMITNYPGVIANGSSLTISPIFNPSGLVGYWNLDEGTGSSTQDLSGNSDIGVWSGTPVGANGTYYAAGKVGQYAGTFDGSSTRITTASSPLFKPAQWTASMWFNASPLIGTSALFRPDYSNGYNSGFELLVYPTNVYLRWGDGTNYNNTIGYGNENRGTWHMLTGSFDGTTMGIYYDGVLRASTTSVVFGYTTSPFGVLIGASGGLTNYAGLLDDVRFYNRALSAAEIQSLYNAEH